MDRLTQLTSSIEQLRTSVYKLVETLRKIAYSLRRGSVCVHSFCLRVKGIVDDKGEFYVSESMEKDFANAIVERCVKMGVEWVEFYEGIDPWVTKLLEFRDAADLVRDGDDHFRKLCEYWCGDVEGKKGSDGLQLLITRINELEASISMDALDKFYERFCDEEAIESIYKLF
jgi:hypothetical protein